MATASPTLPACSLTRYRRVGKTTPSRAGRPLRKATAHEKAQALAWACGCIPFCAGVDTTHRAAPHPSKSGSPVGPLLPARRHEPRPPFSARRWRAPNCTSYTTGLALAGGVLPCGFSPLKLTRSDRRRLAIGLEVAFPRQRCHSLELSPLPGLSLRISPRRRRGLIPCGTSFWLAEDLLSCWGSSLRRLPRAFPPCHETHSTLFAPLVTNRKLAASSFQKPAPTALHDPHHRQAALTCRASAGPVPQRSDCNRPAASSNPCAR